MRVSLLVVLLVSVTAFGLVESGVVYQLFERLGYTVLCKNLFSEVTSNYSEVRGLSPSHYVKLNIVNLRWVEEHWGGGGDNPQLQVEEDIYKALLMMPDDFSLRDIENQKTLSIMAAASSGEIYVVEEYFNPSDRVQGSKTLAHELTHIIQGDHFPHHHTSWYDASQAWSALIEGDASVTADMYAQYLSLTTGTAVQGASIPSPLIDLWLFPYLYGPSFVSHLHSVGGWNLVNNAYYRTPNTTEQILHPEKYLRNEGFQIVSSPAPLPPYVVLRTDRLGEYFISVFLSSHIDPQESGIASTGWNGDNFTYYKVGEDSIFVWSITWDTERDQQEFHEAIETMMKNLEATPLEYNRWKIGWRYITLREEDDGITRLTVSSTLLESP